MQEVGRRLMDAATHGVDLVVVAEALDALFDVFADDATDPVAQSLQLTQRLQSILPQLKTKVRQYLETATAQGLGKTVPRDCHSSRPR